jgi:hypothetical protein
MNGVKREEKYFIAVIFTKTMRIDGTHFFGIESGI